jgi:hypothetical protein
MNWNEVLEQVAEFQENNRFVWFRGQGKITYELKSSLFRQRFTTIEEFLVNERGRYNWFKNLGHIHHNADDWELVCLMQHHGVKTRLLDWTESFATALYFASEKWEENQISIWMLNPQRLNYKSIQTTRYFTIHNDSYRARLYQEDDKKFFDNSVALHPIRSNNRIVAQQGMFTIQGNTLKSLDKEFDGSLIEEGILKEIRIDYDCKSEVFKFLKLVGMHPFSIYPDLNGLADYVNQLTDDII